MTRTGMRICGTTNCTLASRLIGSWRGSSSVFWRGRASGLDIGAEYLKSCKRISIAERDREGGWKRRAKIQQYNHTRVVTPTTHHPLVHPCLGPQNTPNPSTSTPSIPHPPHPQPPTQNPKQNITHYSPLPFKCSLVPNFHFLYLHTTTFFSPTSQQNPSKYPFPSYPSSATPKQFHAYYRHTNKKLVIMVYYSTQRFLLLDAFICEYIPPLL